MQLMGLIETIGDKFLLGLSFLSGVDNFFSVLQHTLNELELVKPQEFEEIVLQGIVGFGRQQHFLQSRGHLGRRETAAVGFAVEQRSNLTTKPEGVESVTAASATQVLMQYKGRDGHYVRER